MKLYLAIPFALALLVFAPLYGALPALALLAYSLRRRGRVLLAYVRKGWNRPAAPEASPVEPDPEPTMITLVSRAPHVVLEVEEDASTTRIFHSFYKLSRAEQQDNLRLNKKGRRLEAAKRKMLSQRRLGRFRAQSSE